ncbi:MAG: hypothetical protein ACE5GT_05495 [Rhodospirillales bacterium]
MAEIASVAVARAAALQTEARNLREQREQERLRLDQARQADAARRQRDIDDQLRADERRLRRLRDDFRVQDGQRRDLDAQDQSQAQLRADEDFARRQGVIQDEIQRARDLEVERALPPLTPRQPVATERTPEDIALARQLNEPERPEPLGPPPVAPDRFAPPEGPDRFAAIAGPGPGAAPPGTAEVAAFDALDGFDQTPAPVSFESLERERNDRLAERRGAERDDELQRRIDLEIADERIANVGFNPNLPPGSIVDVLS